MRIRCWLFGCDLEDFGSPCGRCWKQIDDDGFHYRNIGQRAYASVASWLSRLRWWLCHRCQNCGKAIRFRSEDSFCSHECREDFMPF